MNARIKNFPKHLVGASAESLFEYLRDKYRLDIKKRKFHNIDEIEKEFLNLLKNLDELTYQNKTTSV